MTPTSTSPTGTSQPAPLLLGGDPQAVPVLRGDCEEGTAGAGVGPDASAPVQDPGFSDFDSSVSAWLEGIPPNHAEPCCCCDRLFTVAALAAHLRQDDCGEPPILAELRRRGLA